MRAISGIVLGALLAAVASCGPPRSSMLDWARMRSAYHAEIFVHDRTIAVRFTNPPGQALVVWDPRIEDGGVVLNGGIASAGGGGERRYCYRLEAAKLASDWHAKVFWRETGGELVRVPVVDEGEEAARVIARCSSVEAP